VTVSLVTDGQTDIKSINGVPVTLQAMGGTGALPPIVITATFANNRTITRADGGSWLADGFAAGAGLRIIGSPNAGDYTIATVNDTTMTITTTFIFNGLVVGVGFQPLGSPAQFSGTVSFDAVRNRLTRTDGGSWLAAGFLEGQRIRITSVGDFKIAVIRGTNATKDNILEFTAERVLPALATGVRSINRLVAVTTFTTSNWNVPQTIEVAFDPFFIPQPNRTDLKDFATQPRLPSRLRGPVTVVDETTTADRSLKAAVKLPGEADAALRPIGRIVTGAVAATVAQPSPTALAALDPVAPSVPDPVAPTPVVAGSEVPGPAQPVGDPLLMVADVRRRQTRL
jgi:hypothetical protein